MTGRGVLIVLSLAGLAIGLGAIILAAWRRPLPVWRKEEHAPAADEYSLADELRATQAELAAERDASRNDPAEQRAERYALEAANLSRRLIALEREIGDLQDAKEREVARLKEQIVTMQSDDASAWEQDETIYACGCVRAKGDYTKRCPQHQLT